MIFGRELRSGRRLSDGEVSDVLNDPAAVRISRNRVMGTTMQDEPLLVYLPDTPQSTDSVGVNLMDPACSVDLVEGELLRAVFTLRNLETIVTGESVRVLMAYARARIQDAVPEGGWLTRSEAYALWLELGGRFGRPYELIGWEKGKLRERLE